MPGLGHVFNETFLGNLKLTDCISITQGYQKGNFEIDYFTLRNLAQKSQPPNLRIYSSIILSGLCRLLYEMGLSND